MTQFLEVLHELKIRYSIPSINFLDLLQIIILAFVFYQGMLFLKRTQAWTLLKGIVLIAIITLIFRILNLNVLYWIISKSFNILLIVAVVIFQPELRSALDKIGRKSFAKVLFSTVENRTKKFSDNDINEIIQACQIMSEENTGALIAIEREVPLNDFEKTGIALDAKITKQLLINAFEHNTPLHDGAMIIRDNRIVAATCYFPLSKNENISKSLGTRHRAAIGITEITDCICIVVSEETGNISVSTKGLLEEDISYDRLRDILVDMTENMAEDNKNKLKILMELFKNEKNS